jgi:[NiFe] hydrogenase diaphorase moiety small subunit
MSNQILKFTVDGVECYGKKGQYVLDAVRESGYYIPTLCNINGIKPRGACRICTVKINGRFMTSCSTPLAEGMEIENNTKELNNLRASIVEILLVEGNHFCPACEKSGDCELQALAYRFRIMAPRYPFTFHSKEIDASHPKLIKDHNRCILCKRCIRSIKDEEGRSLFAFKRRGHNVIINFDEELSANMSDELAQKAMDICPVGSLLKKEKGFDTPIGKRKYDKVPIGSEYESFEKAEKK